ncbi:MAG: hypothetical protein P8125_05305 [Gemmatimonadota bacterium]|jgi:hypothetical protein
MRLRFAGGVILPILAVALISPGCAEDTPYEGPPSQTLTGDWNFGVTIVEETGDCAGSNEPPWNALAEITQTGAAVVISSNWNSDGVDGPYAFVGTLDGMVIQAVGEYPEGGGTTSATYSLTVDANWNRMTGNEIWSWTSGESSCVDSRSVVVANRVNPD